MKKEIRKHRLVIRNSTSFKNEEIEKYMQKEIGKVAILDWKIEDVVNWRGSIDPYGGNYDQCLTTILVRYTRR